MGFEPNMFVQPVDDNLVCSVCRGVLDRPTTACGEGHTFCEECLAKWRRRSSDCPGCRSHMTDGCMSRPLHNLILGLRVKCLRTAVSTGAGGGESGEEETEETPASGSSASSGAAAPAAKRSRPEGAQPSSCTWEGTLGDSVESHSKHCPFVSVVCNQCGRTARASDLETHLASECALRSVTCPDCNQSVTVAGLSNHREETCPEAMTACSFCGEAMLRKKLGKCYGRERSHPSSADIPTEDDCKIRCCDCSSPRGQFTGHYRTCPRVQLRCEFSHVGCRDEVRREDLAEHHATHAQKHAHLVSTGMARMVEDQKWQKMEISWMIPLRDLEAQRSSARYARDSSSVKVAGNDIYLRLVVTNDGSDVEAKICTKNPRWAPVQVRHVRIIANSRFHYDEPAIELWDPMNMEREDDVHFVGGKLKSVMTRGSDDGSDEEFYDHFMTLQDFIAGGREFQQDASKALIWASFEMEKITAVSVR